MRISSQVYVKNSSEAVKAYCRAFDAKIAAEYRDEKGNYEHCELTVDGKLFMALSEAPEDCENETCYPWRTMAFNVYEMGTQEAVRKAFAILADGGTVVDEVGPCPWNDCCANVIDKYGVFWWIAI